ncbi:RidA family protein [Streptomyces sp. NEAU-174]|uniref:RidA family protein n=1 Tax=Streptomyces sp. NEAU-174 TaxID=3458254 RepID=UPI004044F4DA
MPQIESLHGPWEWAEPVGYAQAVRVGETITTGGIGPYNEHGNVIDGTFEDQVRQTFRNVEAVLRAFGADLTNVVSMNVYVTESDDYGRFTIVRPEFLTAPYPASTAVGVTLLAEGMQVEMNAVALLGAIRVPAPPVDSTPTPSAGN